MNIFDQLLTQPIFNLLALIYNFVGDFGISIIILTVMIRFLLWPLVKKQLHQTKLMRNIQPELKKIKKKAKGNRMLESQMMMELYRERGIKPFSSILVLIIQLPIFFAIFRVVQIFAGSQYNAVNHTSPADVIYPFLDGFGRIPELLAGGSTHLFGIIDLTKTAGSYAPANRFRSGWTNSFDVRINQDFPGFMEGHKTSLTLDIMNVGNLLNKRWGLIEDAGFNSNLAVANFAGLCNAAAITSGVCPAGSEGKYAYHFTGAQNHQVQEVNGDGVNTGVSRWSAQLTFRYQF